MPWTKGLLPVEASPLATGDRKPLTSPARYSVTGDSNSYHSLCHKGQNAKQRYSISNEPLDLKQLDACDDYSRHNGPL
jgi:hypothetical protein